MRWHASGQVSLSGDLLRLAANADAAFVQLAGVWGAEAERHPSTLPSEVLNRTGYLRSFPHQATLAVGLDPATVGDFAKDPDQDPRPFLGPATEILTPAACYHLYPAHEGESLDEPLYLTTVNTCYRRETVYVPLRRQWSFTMREIVCVGTGKETAHFAQRTTEAVTQLFDLAGLDVEWEHATDPFFEPEQNPAFLMQKLSPVKREATYGDLAISSVNLHHEHFGEAFGITRDGQDAHTACVAFGLERWLAAVLGTHGEDPRSWPDLSALAAEVVAKWHVS